MKARPPPIATVHAELEALEAAERRLADAQADLLLAAGDADVAAALAECRRAGEQVDFCRETLIAASSAVRSARALDGNAATRAARHAFFRDHRTTCTCDLARFELRQEGGRFECAACGAPVARVPADPRAKCAGAAGCR